MVKKQLITLIGFLLTACSSTAELVPLESESSLKQGMVVTANPLATKAGADILRKGGSAVDAAIAIEAVLSLVEPQSSGLGGGGFMVYFDNQSKSLVTYDGRETAPKNANERMFLNDQGESIGFLNAKNSGLSTGVPGMVSMLKLAHDDYGVLPWGPHFDSAKNLAREGFAVSPRLHGMIKRFGKYIPSTKDQGPIDAHNYFFDASGEPLAIGAIRKNQDYFQTLELISNDPDDFYRGKIADLIVEQTSQSPRSGSLSLDDLAKYEATKRKAICSPYKDMQLCGPPPPSSWLAVGQIMGLIEAGKENSSAADGSIEDWVSFAQAQRLAYADRDQFVGDAEFVSVPVNGLLSPEYWRKRAQDTEQDKAAQAVSYGDPWEFESTERVAYGKDATEDMAGTTHFVVMDLQGNVVSMTASVESIFGSTRMAGGMFLNNQLTDFSFKPKDSVGREVANRIAPAKRPRSSMSPTIVLSKDGEFSMATGSPGGNSIIAYTAKTLVGVLDWGLSPQEAVELPNMVARGSKVRIEKERASDELVQGLKDYGFNVKESAGENSGLSVIFRNEEGVLMGGVDPRREGTIEVVEATN